ncbi:MAG TPA: ABC transporter permease [Kofleriaceae bacterium]|jgi:putative ABC transport system permease protein|nr:ABC transporter permease [Kofleriaceae bacterium]
MATTKVAIRALLRNKVRSFLTTLGIIVGVGAVIAMVAIGEGAKAQVEEAFKQMGTNLLVVLPGSSQSGGARGGFGSQPTITWDDLDAIRTQVPSVRSAAPQLMTGQQIVSEDQNWFTQIIGTAPEFFEIRSWKAVYGQPFGQPEVDGGAKVVVLGQTVVEKLFGKGANPVGLAVRIKNVPFTIVGVLVRKGQSPFGQDYDDTVIIPASSFAAKIQGGLSKFLSGQILVAATSSDSTARAQQQISDLLRQRHRLAPGVEDDFNIRNLAQIANARQDSAKTLTIILASIAAVSLLVGGIGIMNIMIVSVTERTREIGLRMAVGAKRRHILAQFLVEALTLSVIGGIFGVALGLLAAQRMSVRFGWPTLVRPDIIAISVGFSAAVGVVFGLYPARKASRLDPIEALRYE